MWNSTDHLLGNVIRIHNNTVKEYDNVLEAIDTLSEQGFTGIAMDMLCERASVLKAEIDQTMNRVVVKSEYKPTEGKNV